VAYSAVLSGSDGSRVGVHEVFHLSTTPGGGSLELDKPAPDLRLAVAV
jgi:hypothetical protein